MFNSLRYRLLAWLLSLIVLIAAIIFPANFLYNRTKNNINRNLEQIASIQVNFLKDQNIISEFLANETTNHDFFITGESSYLNKHGAFKKQIEALKNNEDQKAFGNENEHLNNAVTSVFQLYNYYCMSFDSLVHYIYEKGCPDYGLTSEMISQANILESSKRFPKDKFLEVRLLEREYFIRNELLYADKLNQLCNDLISNILISKNYSTQEKKLFIVTLKAYKEAFNKIVELDNHLGFKTQSGLKGQLNKTSEAINVTLAAASTQAIKIKKQQLVTLNIFFAILAILFLAGAAYFNGLLSRYLVKHLQKLKSYISSIANSNFNEIISYKDHKTLSEIQQIYKEVHNMHMELQNREKQRDKALTHLRDSEKRYRELADLLPQSIYETDELGNLRYVNQAWYKAFGYTQEDLKLGINLIEIINTDYSSVLFSDSKVENTDCIAIRKDGSKFPAIAYSETIIENDQVAGRLGIIIDATLRNKHIESLRDRTQRAIASDKQKSSFLANMSHEIRTPMNSIIGFANLLASDQVPNDQKTDFVKLIQSSSQMLLNLIDDIIDIAKIEAGEIKIKKGECHPKTIINEIYTSFTEYKTQIDKDHLKLKLAVPDSDIVFKTDVFRLRQILTNLVNNAVKFTEEGEITIGLKKKSEQLLEFFVEDTGIGMTREELRDVFERFKRTKTSEKKNISGSGLGLAITKNLIELLGGQMWVNSKPNKGTKFTFELPYIHIPSNTTIEYTKVADKSNYNWKDRTVLVAEDDQNSYNLIEQILKKTQIRIIHAKNGKEAVEACRIHNNIDIILMDIQMPKLSGFDATKQIRIQNPSITVIAQTAYAMEGDKERSILAGCNDYITKPIHPDSLLDKMDQFLNTKVTKTEENNTSQQEHDEPTTKNIEIKTDRD